MNRVVLEISTTNLVISAMQLDIFADSRDVMLRNDVLRAVQRYDAQSASQALAAFAQEYPDDRDRSLLGVLVNSLLRRSSEPFIDHGDVFLAHRWLSTEVHPAATRDSATGTARSGSAFSGPN